MPLSFRQLFRILQDFGYQLSHQRGSHQTYLQGDKSLTIPHHKELKPGTAHSILQDIALHQGISLQQLKKDYQIKL